MRAAEGADPERLAARIARAGALPGAARALLLDVDGTLAPIVSRPEHARVPEGALAALGSLLRGGWSVAAVSGRPSSQVRRMIPLRGVAVFGSHALEAPPAHGGRARVPEEVARRLRRLRSALRPLAEATPGARLEEKPAGLAVHDREVPPEWLGELRSRVRLLLRGADLGGLEVLPGRRVVEIRVAGVHKGRAVAAWPPARDAREGDRSVVAIGDDRTDEDLFLAVGRGGTTVRVGRPGVATAARYRLASPRAVERLLERLAGTLPPARR